MQNKVFPGVLTRAEARDWRARFGSIKDELFHPSKKGKADLTAQQMEDVLKKHVPQEQFSRWQDFFSAQRDGFQKELETVIKDLEGYENCEITIARPLSKAAYDRVMGWLRSQNIFQVILDFKVDETIGGGALIAFGGKIYDYTLKRKIAGEFKNG